MCTDAALTLNEFVQVAQGLVYAWCDPLSSFGERECVRARACERVADLF